MKPFTQIELANFLGVKQPTVSKYLNGQLEISAKFANALEREFGIPTEFWDNPKTHFQNHTKRVSQHSTTKGA